MSQYPSNQTLQADVLLVTVTAVETVAVRRQFPVVQRHFIGNRTYYDLGEVGGARVFLVRSEMGAGGQGGAILTIQKGIDELSPSAIIMVGIAFGVDPTKQKTGDILVSQQILDYELQRVGSGPDQKSIIISKGDKAAASLRLLNRFRDGEMEWQEAKEQAEVRFGLILSGAKLVDNQDFREQLRAFGPDAVGGEMEGAGLYAAAQSNKVDWILVKAICDWADGNKGVNKEANQELAATNAARFVRYVIELEGLGSERSHYSSVPVAAPTSGQTQIPQSQSPKQIPQNFIIEETKTMRWETIQRNLRIKLSELFFQEQSIRALVRDVDETLEASIVWNGSPADCWSGILKEVRSQHLELELIEAAILARPRDATLQQAKEDFKMLLQQSTPSVTSTPSNVPLPLPRRSQPVDRTGPIEVFISYSEDDEKFKKQLETHLSLLRREKVINPWHSQQAALGKLGRDQEIANRIDSAEVILLLMSPSFIASDQLYENEMTRAIDRQKAGEPVRVIPIAVRYIAPSDPDKTQDYQKIQGLPRNGKPIESWRSADEAWAQIAGEIRAVCKDLRRNK